MKSIYEYLDYRLYLSDYYASRKGSGSGFSYRIWADKAGFKAKDFILRVMRGSSRLSPHSAAALAKSMDLSQKERTCFKTMVLFSQAGTFEEREKHFAALHRMHARFKPRAEARVLPYDHFEFYSEWYHAAVRSLISSYGFTDDYAWLAKKVYPAISISKARKSVALLAKLDLIKKDASGVYRVTDADITTGDEVKKGALMKFYNTGMKQMIQALAKLPIDKRNISGLTAGISKSTYSKIVDKIRTFRKELALLAKNDPAPDRVYQVNFHVYPLSRVSGKSGNKP